MSTEGYPIVGFTTDRFLMLDPDLAKPSSLVRYCKSYTKFYRLGCVLITKTSEPWQIDLFGKRLGNFTAIFGKPIEWQEILWHVEQAYKARVVSKQFLLARIRDGTTTERVNRKNLKKSYPTAYRFIRNGDNAGCKEYVEFWANNRKIGMEKGLF